MHQHESFLGALDARCHMMGKLTTHVLDTHGGIPAGGVRIELYLIESGATRSIGTYVTADNGRVPSSLLEGDVLRRGRYELTFHIGAYFRSRGVPLTDPAFLEEAVVRIGIADTSQHYHVPLLITPWSYSVYRGG